MRRAERLGIPLDEESLLYVGRLDAIKGADVLLRALGLMAERPRLRLRIVGGEVDTDYAARLRGLASELGVAGRVTWVGLVPNDELPMALLSRRHAGCAVTFGEFQHRGD